MDSVIWRVAKKLYDIGRYACLLVEAFSSTVCFDDAEGVIFWAMLHLWMLTIEPCSLLTSSGISI